MRAEGEKLFGCRLVPRHQRLKQSAGQAGADVPDVAKCPLHAVSRVCGAAGSRGARELVAAEWAAERRRGLTTNDAT